MSQTVCRVSYILATRGTAPTLPRALGAAVYLKQPGDELIVIAGPRYALGRPEGVDSLLPNDSGTLAWAWNTGVRVAWGRYVKFLSDDDEYRRSECHRAWDVMDAHPDVDILLCGGTKVGADASGRMADRAAICVPAGVGYGKSPQDVPDWGCCGCGLFIRRSAFDRVEPLPDDCQAVDSYLALSFISAGVTLRFCRLNTYTHYLWPHSAMVSMRETIKQEAENMRAKFGLGPRCKRPSYHDLEPVWDGGFS